MPTCPRMHVPYWGGSGSETSCWCTGSYTTYQSRVHMVPPVLCHPQVWNMWVSLPSAMQPQGAHSLQLLWWRHSLCIVSWKLHTVIPLISTHTLPPTHLHIHTCTLANVYIYTLYLYSLTIHTLHTPHPHPSQPTLRTADTCHSPTLPPADPPAPLSLLPLPSHHPTIQQQDAHWAPSSCRQSRGSATAEEEGPNERPVHFHS